MFAGSLGRNLSMPAVSSKSVKVSREPNIRWGLKQRSFVVVDDLSVLSFRGRRQVGGQKIETPVSAKQVK